MTPRHGTGVSNWVVPLAALLTAACSAPQPNLETKEERVTSLREIAGPWDIASFAGYVPTRLHEGVRSARVDVGPDRLSYVIECNHSGNRARIDGEGILHDLEGGRVQTLMGCPAERSARDRAFFAFFASKPKVSRVGAKRLRLTNGRTELLLERPELRRLSFLVPRHDLAGNWTPLLATAVNPKRGSTGETFARPSRVVLTPDSLSFSGCGGVRFTFRYTRDGRMTGVAEQGRGECGDDFPGETLLNIMRRHPTIERDATGLALTAGTMAVNLEKEAENAGRPASPQDGRQTSGQE